MSFFNSVVSAVVGAVAAVANAVKSIVSAVSGNGSQAAGGIESAASGAMAIIADVFEDGEIDEDEEELLEEAFKLLVGAFIGMFGSSGSGSNSIDRKSEVLDEGTINTGKNLYTLQEANEYINCNIWGFDMGHKVYLPNQVSSLPEQIAYKSGGYTYVYELQECPPSTFNGIEIPNDDIVLGDGTILSTKLYSYGIVYTDEPKGPELLIGIVSALPGKSQFNIKAAGKAEGQVSRNAAFRAAKRAAKIPNSTQGKKPVQVFDSSSENRIVHEFEVDGQKKYIIEHREDKFGRGFHFHGADDLKESPLKKGRYNQYPGHFPEDFNGYIYK